MVAFWCSAVFEDDHINYHMGDTDYFNIWYSKRMKNKKYHNVGTFPRSNRKTKNTTLSEHFQNLIEKQKIPHSLNISKIK